MSLELSQISSLQFSKLNREKSVFFFPVGPLEDHGPHLPLGLDLEESTQLCRVAAQHLEEEMPGWTGVMMPPAPLGLDTNTTQIAFTVRPYVLRDWLVDTCDSLMRNGFIHFVVFSGHAGPKQLTAIEDAAALIYRKAKRRHRFKTWFVRSLQPIPRLVSATSSLTSKAEFLRSPFWPDPEEHGGAKDTSLALAIVPKSVDANYGDLPRVQKANSRWKRNWLRRRHLLAGYWGDPSAADKKSGEYSLFGTLEEVFPKLRKVWEHGANPNRQFRSWYSILPQNKSFFKAWLLIISVCMILSGWAYLTLFGIQIE